MTDVEKDSENKVENVEGGEDLNNPYAYLDREDFTSEKFKILVTGLPKYYGIKQFKKLLNEKLNLQTCKIKPLNSRNNWIFVNFRNEEAREHGLSTINGMTWKNCKLTAKKAKAAPDPYVKRKLEDDERNSKKFKGDEDNDQEQKEESLSVLDLIKSSTIPLWNVPYETQLTMKQDQMRSIIVKIGQQIARANNELIGWIEKQRAVNNGLICELQPILNAEVTEGYRNKCEFTIGKNENEILIGFRLSSYAAGSTAVGPIDHLCHIPERMKVAVKIFQKFVRDSKLDVYDPVNHKGFWNQVTARATRLGHLMLIIGVYPKNLPTDSSFDELVTKITKFFEEGEGKDAKVTSLYIQTMGISAEGENHKQERQGPIKHLSGSLHIEESLMGLKFRISPQAFFQINSQGAEILYQAAIDLAQCDKENTSLLDICCGTGTIGLCFSQHCSEVLGIEIVNDAINDAKENAKQNNINNCEFFVGKAESLIKPVLHRTSKETIIAVVDPPRAGLHHEALLALRKTDKVKKVLYVSCDPKAAMKNLVDLARPISKQYLGEPLVPVKAIPVDMFPMTNHCELIILLERLSATKSYSDIKADTCE
ncbi:tRNA (uracil-5-)-methyltransferase homolog A-like [Microplitis mediator]|uniref:tRNA (uracil-5-)-methyltransferase homolog A-like n=1 Tax=Microplitis mediator TaxID=375433 RepID=UPI002553D118|nr:tRNA (uracil-5-)-methyltransferase homolog A-like [Microplitis mediator]